MEIVPFDISFDDPPSKVKKVLLDVTHQVPGILKEPLASVALVSYDEFSIRYEVRYFIDDFGVHCAVGYLIEQSGNGDLALEISEKFNYNYIEDIPSSKMLDWAEKFGFTVDELKWIQPGYPPVQTLNQLGNGTNG